MKCCRRVVVVATLAVVGSSPWEQSRSRRQSTPTGHRATTPATHRASFRATTPASPRVTTPASPRSTAPASHRAITPASHKAIILAYLKAITPASPVWVMAVLELSLLLLVRHQGHNKRDRVFHFFFFSRIEPYPPTPLITSKSVESKLSQKLVFQHGGVGYQLSLSLI